MDEATDAPDGLHPPLSAEGILQRIRISPIRSGIIEIRGECSSVTLRLNGGDVIPDVDSTVVRELHRSGALPAYLCYQLSQLHIIDGEVPADSASLDRLSR